MVDNTTTAAGTGGDTIATDDLTTLNGGAVSGFKVQRVKVGYGPDSNLRDVEAAFPLPVYALNNSLVSTANSTAVNLGVGAVFTGTAEDVSEYSSIMVSVFASHVSATDGLSMQQSTDGTNWDLADVYTVAAATGKTFNVAVNARFYRLVYTNGATLTTALRLQTIYSKAVKRSSSVRPQDGRSNENDFEELLAFMGGWNGTGWDRLRSTIANGLAVDVTRAPLTSVSGTRLNNGTAATAGAFHLTVGGSDGTNLRPMSVDTTGRLNTNTAPQPTTLAVTVTAAANTGATLTLPAVAGQFHYITGIEIMRTSTAALAGTATLVATSTNLPGALAWSFGNAMAAGATQRDLVITFPNPIKSSVVNTATTVVMPAPGAAVLWRANIYYYTAA